MGREGAGAGSPLRDGEEGREEPSKEAEYGESDQEKDWKLGSDAHRRCLTNVYVTRGAGRCFFRSQDGVLCPRTRRCLRFGSRHSLGLFLHLLLQGKNVSSFARPFSSVTDGMPMMDLLTEVHYSLAPLILQSLLWISLGHGAWDDYGWIFSRWMTCDRRFLCVCDTKFGIERKEEYVMPQAEKSSPERLLELSKRLSKVADDFHGLRFDAYGPKNLSIRRVVLIQLGHNLVHVNIRGPVAFRAPSGVDMNTGVPNHVLRLVLRTCAAGQSLRPKERRSLPSSLHPLSRQMRTRALCPASMRSSAASRLSRGRCRFVPVSRLKCHLAPTLAVRLRSESYPSSSFF